MTYVRVRCTERDGTEDGTWRRRDRVRRTETEEETVKETKIKEETTGDKRERETEKD